jgi:hypothetical protein
VTAGPTSPGEQRTPWWRVALALVAVAAVAALAALVLGEYELEAGIALPAGLLLGLVLGEVAVAAGRDRGLLPALLVGALGAGAMVWAGWIDSAQGLEPIKTAVWFSAALAALAGALRVRGLPRITAARRSR